MPLTWSGVQFVSNEVAIGLSDTFHGVSFLQILPDQAIGVFVRSSLPGVVGGGEVAGDRVARFDAGVVVELCSVVEGDGFETAPMFFEGF